MNITESRSTDDGAAAAGGPSPCPPEPLSPGDVAPPGRTADGQRRASPAAESQVISKTTTPGPGRNTKDVDEMAASLVIEEESGTTTARVHAHNGYYAGDFSSPRYDTRTSTPFSNVLA